MADSDPEDEDRKAILSRRNRFVAIALSGLTSTMAPACSDDDSSPHACLSVEEVQMTPIEPPKPELPPPEAPPPPPTAMEDPPDIVPPRVCLRRAPPRACLSQLPRMRPPPPQPCLDYAVPQPCLEYIEKPGGHDDEGDA